MELEGDKLRSDLEQKDGNLSKLSEEERMNVKPYFLKSCILSSYPFIVSLTLFHSSRKCEFSVLVDNLASDLSMSGI